MVECVKFAKGILGSKEKSCKFNLMSKQQLIKNNDVMEYAILKFNKHKTCFSSNYLYK
jgi:hypothetical protein